MKHSGSSALVPWPRPAKWPWGQSLSLSDRFPHSSAACGTRHVTPGLRSHLRKSPQSRSCLERPQGGFDRRCFSLSSRWLRHHLGALSLHLGSQREPHGWGSGAGATGAGSEDQSWGAGQRRHPGEWRDPRAGPSRRPLHAVHRHPHKASESPRPHPSPWGPPPTRCSQPACSPPLAPHSRRPLLSHKETHIRPLLPAGPHLLLLHLLPGWHPSLFQGPSLQDGPQGPSLHAKPRRSDEMSPPAHKALVTPVALIKSALSPGFEASRDLVLAHTCSLPGLQPLSVLQQNHFPSLWALAHAVWRPGMFSLVTGSAVHSLGLSRGLPLLQEVASGPSGHSLFCLSPPLDCPRGGGVCISCL